MTFKIDDTIQFSEAAIEFGIGSKKNVGQILNIRNKGRGKLAQIRWDNGKVIEVNIAWIICVKEKTQRLKKDQP